MPELLTFRDPKLLNMALTHSSYANENPMESQDNERLEFLGDAILNFLSGDYLYARYPTMTEAELTKRRITLTDEKQLAQFALRLGLDSKIRFGKGAEKEREALNANLLSSTFEAVVGAYYLDRDAKIDAVRPLVNQLFNFVSEDIISTRSDLNAKNRFQEWVQANLGHTFPNYVVEKVGGVDHAPQFVAKVYVGDRLFGESAEPCRSKKEAEKQAAMDAIARLG
ncbi:ribonuclease III [Tumidithrix elongata]|uniref:ribonuclease III n=1 Tax=Tumidithrix elongata TaxID=3088357 RepID=UPI0038CDC2E2